MIELIAKCGSTYIAKVQEGSFLMVDVDQPTDYGYAWSPDVFIRFNPYFVNTSKIDEDAQQRIQVLLDSGKLPATDHDVMDKPPQR